MSERRFGVFNNFSVCMDRGGDLSLDRWKSGIRVLTHRFFDGVSDFEGDDLVNPFCDECSYKNLPNVIGHSSANYLQNNRYFYGRVLGSTKLLLFSKMERP
jgi:hypothetical protein